MTRLFIVWNKDHETGIQILDEQRRGFVSLINSFFFHRGDASGDIHKILVPTAEMFQSFVEINCATVEELMHDSGYPELEKYKKVHEEMIRNIRVKDIQYRRVRDAQGFLDFLKDFWLKTVQHNESEYLEYLIGYYNAQRSRD